MQDYQRQFIDFMVRVGALRFGEFTLKSGRRSPYFFNSGAFASGDAVARLGAGYAQAALTLPSEPTIVFGPAYKGIPLAVATAMMLKTACNVDAAFCFDRKEAKGHGDRGAYVGQQPQPGDRVLLVDDVITDGATKREAVARLREDFDGELIGLVIALNRMERTAEGTDPVEQLERDCRLPVRAIVSIAEVLEHLHGREIDGRVVVDDTVQAKVHAYLEQYGVG